MRFNRGLLFTEQAISIKIAAMKYPDALPEKIDRV